MRVLLDGVQKSYSERKVLDIKSLKLESGRIYAVLGPNGSGKTTMLRLISGIETPDCGKIYYNDEARLPSNNISFLPQKPYMFDMPVLRNVTLGIGSQANGEKNALEALNHVGMLDFANARMVSLSGGESQRVAVARTLVLEKQLILLDEPASAADISSMRLIEAYIKMISRRDKSTVVLTTHNPSQAVRIADEIIILWDGDVIEMGEPQRIYDSPERAETREFLSNWRPS